MPHGTQLQQPKLNCLDDILQCHASAHHKCAIEQSESVTVVSKPSKLFKGIDAAQSWHLHRNSQIKVLNSYYIFLGTIAELL